MARHVRLYFQPDTEMAMVAELRPDYAWLPLSLPLTAALERAGWHRLYAGGVSVILSRESQAAGHPPQLAVPALLPGTMRTTVFDHTAGPKGQTRPEPVELRWQIWLPWSALALILLSATGTDPDLWGHVRFGLDFLRNRALPSVDPYSFTQDRPWVNHEWLSEALMAAAFALCGTAGLVILKTLVMACAVSVVWRRLRGASPVISTAVTTLAIVGALP